MLGLSLFPFPTFPLSLFYVFIFLSSDLRGTKSVYPPGLIQQFGWPGLYGWLGACCPFHSGPYWLFPIGEDAHFPLLGHQIWWVGPGAVPLVPTALGISINFCLICGCCGACMLDEGSIAAILVIEVRCSHMGLSDAIFVEVSMPTYGPEWCHLCWGACPVHDVHAQWHTCIMAAIFRFPLWELSMGVGQTTLGTSIKSAVMWSDITARIMLQVIACMLELGSRYGEYIWDR